MIGAPQAMTSKVPVGVVMANGPGIMAALLGTVGGLGNSLVRFKRFHGGYVSHICRVYAGRICDSKGRARELHNAKRQLLAGAGDQVTSDSWSSSSVGQLGQQREIWEPASSLLGLRPPHPNPIQASQHDQYSRHHGLGPPSWTMSDSVDPAGKLSPKSQGLGGQDRAHPAGKPLAVKATLNWRPPLSEPTWYLPPPAWCYGASYPHLPNPCS